VISLEFILLAVHLGLPAMLLIFILMEILVPVLYHGKNKWQVSRNAAKVYILLSTIIMAASYPLILRNAIVFELDLIFGQGIFFQIDMLNYPFLVLAGILWLSVGYYSKEEIHYLFFITTYMATIGTLLAGDLLSFFLFFEIATFSSYALMVSHQGKEQLKAGFVYIYMGIIGGLLVLGGILLLVSYTGNSEWTYLAVRFSDMGLMKYLIAFMLLAGFGVKAGMVPFQYWMPRIYEKAPFAVVAISSGMLIKVAVYGMMKVMFVIFFAEPGQTPLFDPRLWMVAETVGAILIWAGLLSMLVGAGMAVLQSNVKKMLAYSSVSQIGYMIMGIGAGAYLSDQGGYGFVGGLYHLVNHSIYKVLLIMAMGMVYFTTDETDLNRLGGLWKKEPAAAIFTMIALLSITGMPGFSGYASKAVLHQGLLLAIESGPGFFRYTDWLFKAAGAGTVCYAVKLYYYVFLRSVKSDLSHPPEHVGWMNKVMGILSLLIVLTGLMPSVLFSGFMIPAARSLAFDPAMTGAMLTDFRFWTLKGFNDAGLTYLLGILLFLVSMRIHIFRLQIPRSANAEELILKPLLGLYQRTFHYFGRKYEAAIIFGDALIYSVMLVFVIFFLIYFRFIGN
jgi:hydrogenase-4 component B